MALAASASGVMMGICAGDAAEGVLVLQRWTQGLGLPKGEAPPPFNKSQS